MKYLSLLMVAGIFALSGCTQKEKSTGDSEATEVIESTISEVEEECEGANCPTGGGVRPIEDRSGEDPGR